MPKIASLIKQYQNDHHPPHFHAIRADEEVLVRIADLGVEQGSMAASALQEVQKWAGAHQPELALN